MSIFEIVFGAVMVGAIILNTGETAFTYGSDLEDAKKSVSDAQDTLDKYKSKYSVLQIALEEDIKQLTEDTIKLSSDISDRQLQIRDLQSLFVNKLRRVEVVGITLVFGIIFLFILKKLKVL